MTTNINQRIIVSAMLVVWLTGCESVKEATLTGHMWEATGSNHREPAMQADLRCYHTMDLKDVLVRYNEELESNGTLKPRAFLLLANEEKLEASKRPSFLSARKADRLQGSPLEMISASETNAAASEELRAVVRPDGAHFALTSNGKVLGDYCLPTYGKVTSSGKIARALFLPATVMGDTAVYGAVGAAFAGVVFIEGMARSGTTYTFRP